MQPENISFDTSAIQALKQARIARGLTQAELADAVACAQSGVSRLEAGNLSALADDKIRQIADFLGVKIDLKAPAKGLHLATDAMRATLRHCASPWCPSAVPYAIRGILHVWPLPVPTAPDEPAGFCTFCGEPMKDRCSKCAHPVNLPGAFCTHCGTPRVRTDDATAAEIIRDRHPLPGEPAPLSTATTQARQLTLPPAP